MLVVKLLSRIVAPPSIDAADTAAFYDHTYGITSDPLTHFSCLLSALIHDVGNSGVPNTTLLKDMSPLAEFCGGRNIAKQNRVDLA